MGQTPSTGGAGDGAAWLRATPDGIEIRLKVVPGASRSQLAGILGDRLKLRIAAPPADGQANRAIEDFLTKLLSHPCRVMQGHGNPFKTVVVAGAQLSAVEKILARG